MNNKSVSKPKDVLLVCTVGGSPRPVALSILHNKPKRILFITSQESGCQILKEGEREKDVRERKIDDRGVLQICREEGVNDIDAGRYAITKVNHQNIESCVSTIRRDVLREIDNWAGGEVDVIFDFTGGTKLMTAALAMVGQRMPIEFSYVAAGQSHGRDARDKEGLGVTLDGEENVLRVNNPWDVLGFQTVETAASLFNQGNYVAAKCIVEQHRNKTRNDTLKQQLSTWINFFEGYLFWDQFDHNGASTKIENVVKNIANIKTWTRRKTTNAIEAVLKNHLDILKRLIETPFSNDTLKDLLANAKRRHSEGRYDDAVARLYRVIEATAQLRLKDRGIESCCVKKNQIPKELQGEWDGRFAQEDAIKLALQDDFKLLKALDEPLGKRFFENGFDRKESLLGLRNGSILAHGFTAIGKENCEKLWTATMKLLEIDESVLTEFPNIEI